jgi:sugar-specific transcriptional regulator TrmB
LLLADEDVKTLTCLGLTERQAKVYLALLLTGAAKAETISKASLVHRQEIYRVVSALQKLGLVEIQLCTPTLFRAIPIDDALNILIRCKKNEFDKTVGKTRSLAEKLNKNFHESIPIKNPSFAIVSNDDRGKKLVEALENSTLKVDVIMTWRRFRQNFVISSHLKRIKSRNIMLRLIIEKPKNESLPKWASKLSEKNTGIKLKTILQAPPVVLWLFDSDQVALVVNHDGKSTAESYLWSNSSDLVALAQGYFEYAWEKLEIESKQQESVFSILP